MRKHDWAIEIIRVNNGYKLRFAAFNDEHDAERIRVVWEKKDAEGNWKEVEED